MKNATPSELQDQMASLYYVDDTPELTPVDRSTLERYATCPAQGRFVETGRVLIQNRLMAAGEEVHRVLGEVTANWIRSGMAMSPADMRQAVEEGLRGARPDVQPDAIRGMRASVWAWVEYIRDLHPDNILKFDGGEGDKSGQLARELPGLGLLPTSELDLLHSVRASKQVLHEVDYKGLPVDTEIPTPSGWTTMGDIQIGDLVFDRNGRQCEVVGKSQRRIKPCYRLVFDDKTSVTCDEDHLWLTASGQILCVKDIPIGEAIEVASPLLLLDADLPVDPYVLGIWLGDGKHSSGEVSKPDRFIFDEAERRGFSVGPNHSRNSKRPSGIRCASHTLTGLRTKLNAAGLLKNKHVPDAYLRASYYQRLDLLRGLMDTDGSVNTCRKQCVFTTISKSLSDQLVELLHTLGQRPHQSSVIARGFGKTVAAYPVSFRPVGINPFLLPRKADKVDPDWGSGYSHRRKVQQKHRTLDRETQCIAVNSPDNTYLCTKSFVPTHNSGHKLHGRQEVRDSFQFQFHWWLVAGNFEGIEALEVVVWNTRLNRRQWVVEFDRRDLPAIETRVNYAAGKYWQAQQLTPEQCEVWPGVEKCQDCPAALACPAYVPESELVGKPPEQLVDELTALKARTAALESHLTRCAKERGSDVVSPSGNAWGLNKPRRATSPKCGLYAVSGAEETNGEESEEALT